MNLAAHLEAGHVTTRFLLRTTYVLLLMGRRKWISGEFPHIPRKF